VFRQLKISIATSLALVALCHAGLATAAPWYEVEVYIFERNAPTNERWPSEVKPLNLSKAIDLISPVIASQTLVSEASSCLPTELLEGICTEQEAVTLTRYPAEIPVHIAAADPLPPGADRLAVLADQSRQQFNNIIRTLERERGNSSLLHLTWQQAMQPRHKAQPVRLFAGRDFSAEFSANGLPVVPQSMEITDQGSQASSLYLNEPSQSLSSLTQGSAEPTMQEMPQPPAPVWQLDGTLNIYLSHYLYIEAHLGLRERGEKQPPLIDETSEAEIQQPQPFLYRIELAQNRRVRSGQIHYFDHPRVGMIMQIRKMAQPEVTQASTAASLGD
jgi:hypothetical protein